MRVSSRAGAVQEDGGGRRACFLEAELAVLDQLERGDEGAAEELEQHVGGEVLPEKSVLEAAREHRSHGRGDEALDLLRVALWGKETRFRWNGRAGDHCGTGSDCASC